MMVLHAFFFTLLNVGRLYILIEMWDATMNIGMKAASMTTFILMEFVMLYVLWGIGATKP